ncbi:BTB/POZ domain-containing protein [Rhizophagus clarus]|uniref:BTB/POZ domain-containing protein n=1 Tax=Rhizophagus clarus TaxID=94130 RepID=A0A8H3L3X9_9GLOM|nr:BTB/POZ domain-containing protein [Rhizophagus clarus]
MSYNFESEILGALGHLLKTEMDYNVIIYIGKEPNIKEFHAHSIILRCRSEYFNKMLSDGNIEKKEGKYLINNPNVSPQAFKVILKYLYTGHLTEDFIIENYQQYLKNNPVEILQIIHYCKPFPTLQKLCLNEICSEPKILFDSDKFIQLPAPLLEAILKRDDLNLEEIEIWENLIKWGLAQKQVRHQDVTKWDQDDIIVFKRILYRFIPLIKFYEISTRDYFNKVKPYEEILPKALRDDILKTYMIPEYKPIYISRHSKVINGSIMINRAHFALFANWISRKKEIGEYGNYIPYKFNLLYRSSRNGNTAAAFHAKCDNKGATIVVVKIKNSEQIVGGYNPLSWDSSNSNKSTKDSFLFSISDKSNIQSANAVYSNGNQYSIGNYRYCGPFFGYDELYVNYSNPSIWYYNSSPSVHTYSYSTLGLQYSMEVSDYEVFQVLKNEI